MGRFGEPFSIQQAILGGGPCWGALLNTTLASTTTWPYDMFFKKRPRFLNFFSVSERHA